ncbi:MAG TPA: M23 family peptidase, partial [Bacilli bacterium]
MEWIISLLLVWGSMTTAADEIAKAEAIQAALVAKEKAQQEAHEAEVEAQMYDTNGVQVLASEWSIMPKTTYQGDVVLVRSSREGTLKWQNKTYPLLRFGKGYYSYLPISISLKPGSYTIGNINLTVLKKSFETQKLTVTKEQEKMTQNIERIRKDQTKINKARSVSEPRFLFDKAFIQPVKGRLSTPYGFTRYV